MIDNNALRAKRELLRKVAELTFNGNLVEEIDKIPILRHPRGAQGLRCCIYKSRAITRYRLLAILGYPSEAMDEFRPLGDYAREALTREKPLEGPVLTVIDEACSGCITNNYVVTDACRGCFARPCIVNCPKDAITMRNGKAYIDPDKCVRCGLCLKVCPYHAIVYVPIPCEEACPVGAIAKDENGKEVIDFEKCIFCGKCMIFCPFGAIMERSQIIDVIAAINSDKKVIAMIAPAVMGQFPYPAEKIAGAVKAVGFDDVWEVASGAEITSQNEAAELIEKVIKGDQKFLTTSCCPAYVEMVKKHVENLLPFVSHTKSPMYYTAEMVKAEMPDAITVFVSPCTAKRYEAENDPLVDYVISIEELVAMFAARQIEVNAVEPYPLKETAKSTGRGYPVSGGVASAVVAYAGNDGGAIRHKAVNGINKSTLLQLKALPKLPRLDFNFLEVMTCEGGCIGGPDVLVGVKMSEKKIRAWIET